MTINERDRSYILRIVEHCTRIEDSCKRFGASFEAFNADADFRDVVCMNIFQIGEIANQISDELREATTDIPWSQMYGIRNILAHAYIKLDSKVVWQTVENDIPMLKEKLEEIL